MCNNVENKQNVVVAPMDTQPLTPNGTKGLWDKHVEMYETTDIPTEYADCEEDWADTEEYVREFIKEAIITKETNIYRITNGNPFIELNILYLLVYADAIETCAEVRRDRMMRSINYLRNGLITEERAKELLDDILYCRPGINYASGTLENIAAIIKTLVDMAGEKGLEVGSYMLTFVPDKDGQAYHSRPETWQKSFGYNIFYDEVFALGSKMNADYIPFSTDDEDYVLWLWKGDYWNLASGAEIGLYYNPENIEGANHYDVIDFELPMTLGLYNYYDEDNIDCVLNWAPRTKQWWVTGFNPEFDKPDCNDMVVIGSIDFEGREEMYEALKDTLEDEYKKYLHYFVFVEDGHSVWIIWDKKE